MWTPVFAYMALIFALSSIPSPPITPAGTDKVLHALLYAGLGALLSRAIAGGDGLTPGTVARAAAVGRTLRRQRRAAPVLRSAAIR